MVLAVRMIAALTAVASLVIMVLVGGFSGGYKFAGFSSSPWL
jgi:hypothetical protein